MIPLCEELRQLADDQDDALGDLLKRAADAIEGKLTVTLTDALDADPDRLEVECRITADPSGIYIRPAGYGDFCSADGEGCPVMLEYYNGEMRVAVWPNINEEDRVDIISLEGAKEDVREDDEDDEDDD